MNRIPLDMYDDLPEGMRNYLRSYGYHFNKKAYEFATSLMECKDERTGKKKGVEAYEKEHVQNILRKYNIVLENDVMYDSAYVATMCKADFSLAIPDEEHLAYYIREVIDDIDAPEGCVFNSFYAKCVRAGIPIEWEELL